MENTKSLEIIRIEKVKLDKIVTISAIVLELVLILILFLIKMTPGLILALGVLTGCANFLITIGMKSKIQRDFAKAINIKIIEQLEKEIPSLSNIRVTYRKKLNKKTIKKSGLIKVKASVLFNMLNDELMTIRERYISNCLIEATWYNKKVQLANVRISRYGHEELIYLKYKEGFIISFEGQWAIFYLDMKVDGAIQLFDKQYDYNKLKQPSIANLKMKKVTINNNEVNNLFDIYTSNEETSNLILNTELLNQILKLKYENLESKILISIKENIVHIGIDNHKTAYDISLKKQIGELDNMIILELKQMINIINNIK